LTFNIKHVFFAALVVSAEAKLFGTYSPPKYKIFRHNPTNMGGDRRFPKGDRRRSSVFIALWSRPQTRNSCAAKANYNGGTEPSASAKIIIRIQKSPNHR
jgi:hypothetical protein